MSTQTKPLAADGLGKGLFWALNATVDGAAAVPTAKRQITINFGVGTEMILRWGTQGFLGYSGDHIFGTKHMPARLQALNPKKNREAFEEGFADVVGEWLGSALERAGAPIDWIQAATGGRF